MPTPAPRHHQELYIMDANTQKIVQMIDRMTATGWIKRSASTQLGGVIEWTDEGKIIMSFLNGMMFGCLDLKPGDESVFAWMVHDFPEGQERVKKRLGRKPE